MGKRKTALLIESHPWLRQTLRQLLADEGFEVVAEAVSVMDGVRQAVDLQPGVVVVDADLAEMSGSLLGQMIQMLVPRTDVILLVDDTRAYGQLEQAGQVAACIDKRLAGHLLAPALKRLFEND